MNAPTTDKEALEQCLILWEHIRDHLGESWVEPYATKEAAVLVTLGYEPLNDCPACEYTCEDGGDGDYYANCWICPIREWSSQTERGVFYACEKDQRSPYRAWLESDDAEDAVENAGLMVDLIKKNLEANK